MSCGLAVGLAIDRGDAVLDPFQVGKRGALDPETVQHDPLRQNAVEVIEDGDQALGTRDFATAHAAHADQRREAIFERASIEAAYIVVGPPSLAHRHPAVFYAAISRAGPPCEVGAVGSSY